MSQSPEDIALMRAAKRRARVVKGIGIILDKLGFGELVLIEHLFDAFGPDAAGVLRAAVVARLRAAWEAERAEREKRIESKNRALYHLAHHRDATQGYEVVDDLFEPRSSTGEDDPARGGR